MGAFERKASNPIKNCQNIDHICAMDLTRALDLASDKLEQNEFPSGEVIYVTKGFPVNTMDYHKALADKMKWKFQPMVEPIRHLLTFLFKVQFMFKKNIMKKDIPGFPL